MNLLDYIIESIEDGKYVELPTTNVYKPFRYPGMIPSKPKQEVTVRVGPNKKRTYKLTDEEYKNVLKRWEAGTASARAKMKEEDDAYKAHLALLKKIDEENFEILIDKVFKALSEKKRREDFIKTNVARVIEETRRTKENGSNKKTWTEKDLFGNLNGFRKAIALDNESKVRSSSYNSLDSYEENIYRRLGFFANCYQIDLPKMSNNDFGKNSLFSSTVNDIMVDWTNNARREISDEKYYKKKQETISKVLKDKEKIAKFRAKWAKTDQYKKLEKIANLIEDDIEQIEKSADRAYQRYDELNGKNKAYDEAKKKVLDTYNEWIDKAFKNTKHATSCYGTSLLDILINLELAGESDPKIEIMDAKTSSWLSGMHHSCKYKVTDSEGKEYITGKYEDRGFDSFDREVGDGFGAYD